MGTDISLYAEQRVKGDWHFLGEMIKNSSFVFGHQPEYYPKDLYTIRNYGLFAILADERNKEGYQPIRPRRGIPGDLSPEIKSYFEFFHRGEADASWPPLDEKQRASWIAYDIDMECHPGWLTLKELLDFAWQETRIQIYARVDERVAHLFHPERSFPYQMWPADIQCSYSTTHKEDPYCNASWTQTYAEAAGGQFMELLDIFAQRYGASEDVRLVFWFDS